MVDGNCASTAGSVALGGVVIEDPRMSGSESVRSASRASRAGLGPVIDCLPRLPGVYRFRDSRGRALYIGRATSLRARVASYWSDLHDRRHLTPMVSRICRIEVVLCDSEHEACWLERNLLEEHLPPFNLTAGGQEVPTYVVLHQAVTAPRLTVTPAPQRSPDTTIFGPYLGATRVRSAVAGLHRVLPLGFSATSGDRSARELATARGMRAGKPSELTDTVTAVLRADADAVAAASSQLVAKRDQAVARLAFEVAANIQSELDGLAWTASPQKVTRPDTGDATIRGWADGVFVSYQIRDGRLSGWTQRQTSGLPTKPSTDSDDAAEWRNFAERNARLAARLMVAASHPESGFRPDHRECL
jgi:excinuclease ABC subunit C